MLTTSRLSLNYPQETDTVTSYPAVNAQQAGILDAAVVYSEGTISSRPSAAIKGRIYKGTDTGLYYFDTGTAWDTVMLAGAWVSLTANAGVTATNTFGRVVGDTAQLRGLATPSGSSIAANTALVTLPTSLAPVNQHGVATTFVSGAATLLQLPQLGITGPPYGVSITSTLAPGATVFLDVSYSLA